MSLRIFLFSVLFLNFYLSFFLSYLNGHEMPVCIYACKCVDECLYRVCECICVLVWRPGQDMRSLPLSLFTFFADTEFLS